MSLTVISGANIVARNVIKALAPRFPSIRLCDFRPYRPSVSAGLLQVYQLEREIGSEKLEKVKTYNYYGLENALEGAETVLYFTHDYTILSPDKNRFLKTTASK